MSHASTILSLLANVDRGIAPDREIPEARAITAPDGSVTGWLFPDDAARSGWVRYDMTDLAATGVIGEAVVTSFAFVQPATQSKATVKLAQRHLRAGLQPYLQSLANDGANTGNVDRAFLEAFRADLDRRFGHTKNYSRSRTFLTCQAHLRASGAFKDVDWIDSPYPKSRLDVVPVEPVDLDDMMTILDAAITETETTMARKAALRDRDHPLWASIDDQVHLEDALLLRLIYPAGPPSRTILKASENADVRRIAHYRLTQAITYGYPTLERLTAFAIILLFLFRLNSKDTQQLKQRSVQVSKVLGIERVAITYHKRRSGTVLSPSFPVDDGPGNPARLIRFLEEWTLPLRDGLGQRHAGRVLIAIAVRGTRRLEKYIGFEDTAFDTRIACFCVRAGVADVTPSRIRKAALRLVDTLTGGDPLMRMAAGGHKSRLTSERHYPGDPDQQDEAMAHGFVIAHGYMLGHQRDHPKSRTPDEDPLCITPGWDCANPFLGVIPGEREKHRCRAYGRCPGCPLGTPDLASPLSYARSKALLTEIQRAEHTMHHPYWLGTWRSVEVRLRTVWMPLFADDARAKGDLIDAPMMEIRDERHG